MNLHTADDFLYGLDRHYLFVFVVQGFSVFLRDDRPPGTFPLTTLKFCFQLNPLSTMTPSDFVFFARFISELFSISGSETSNLLSLRGWPINMYSVVLGLAVSLLILIHSEMLRSSL